jgi:hypothetical protein
VTIFDVAYILAGLTIVAFELLAVWKQNRPGFTGPKQTVSHKVIAWIAARPKRRRVFVIVGLVWLTWHWAFQPF